MVDHLYQQKNTPTLTKKVVIPKNKKNTKKNKKTQKKTKKKQKIIRCMHLGKTKTKKQHYY